VKSRATKMMGRKVRLTADGPLGVIVNVASQERRPMVQVRFDDGTTEWAQRSDTIPAEPGD
jgi:hypothetical protein